MTRIIGGSAKGRPLRTPPGDSTRPTSDRVREALFSMLTSEFGNLNELAVLDLYAGSGAVGLEALSRGAASAVLVEQHRAAAGVCRANAEATGLAAQVRQQSVSSYLAGEGERFDVVFLDPPYDVSSAAITDVLAALVDRLTPNALIVVERSARGDRPVVPEGLVAVGERRYGETVLILLEPSSTSL